MSKVLVATIVVLAFLIVGCGTPRLHQTKTTFRYGEADINRHDEVRPWDSTSDAWWIEQSVTIRY
jgi:hypothetical protein